MKKETFKHFDEEGEGLFTYLTFHRDKAYYINQQLYVQKCDNIRIKGG